MASAIGWLMKSLKARFLFLCSLFYLQESHMTTTYWEGVRSVVNTVVP